MQNWILQENGPKWKFSRMHWQFDDMSCFLLLLSICDEYHIVAFVAFVAKRDLLTSIAYLLDMQSNERNWYQQKMGQTGCFVNEIMFSMKRCIDFNTIYRRYACAEVCICWAICANTPRRHKCFNFCLRSVFRFRHIKTKITMCGNAECRKMKCRASIGLSMAALWRIEIILIISHVLQLRIHQPIYAYAYVWREKGKSVGHCTTLISTHVVHSSYGKCMR